MLYEWNEEKRLQNIEKHAIDFFDAKDIWSDGDVVEFPSPQSQHNEQRIVAIGILDGRYITVIYTWRGDKKRLISARKARGNEKIYHDSKTR